MRRKRKDKGKKKRLTVRRLMKILRGNTKRSMTRTRRDF